MTATTTPSTTHVLLIPSYNTGERLAQTVRDALAQWRPVWVVIDGSTDGSAEAVEALAQIEPGLRVIELPSNCGKGAAVLHGMECAQAEGFTHALTMDADGQHPANLINRFMQASIDAPACVVLGKTGVRRERALVARARAAHLELVGQCRDPGRRHRRFFVRLSRLSAGGVGAHHAFHALDATLRFRSRTRRASVLGRCASAQPRCAGQIFQRRRRRRPRISITCATTPC